MVVDHDETYGDKRMSWDALSLAAKANCKTPTAKPVLRMLANYADENFACYPSLETLSRLCGCDGRTIRRALKSLEDSGLIRVQAQFAEDGKQTSNLYIIQRWGDIFAGEGVTNSTPNTVRDKHNNKEQRGDNNDTPKQPQRYPSGFEEWWNAYPRNDGSKKKAFEIWKRVIDRDIDERDLFIKTCRFAQTTHGKDKKFVPHATTWLNQGRWETVEQTQQKTTNRNQLAG